MGTIDINTYPTVRDRKMCLGTLQAPLIRKVYNMSFSIHLRKQTRMKAESQVVGQQELSFGFW